MVSTYDFPVPGAWIHLEVESVALRVAQRKGKAVDLSGLHGDRSLALSILSSLNPGKAQCHGRSCDSVSRPFTGEKPTVTLLNIYIPMQMFT